jgi:5-methylcytosine-specific restriction endonuclease McrA
MIWKKRPHECESCGRFLGNEALSSYFDHLLEKSTYPELRYKEENIFLVCVECHDKKTRGFPTDKHKEAIVNFKTKYNYE